MTDNKGDIEKLFQESFDSFEADVDPSIWNNIADKIGTSTSPTDPSSSTSAASSSGLSSGISVAKIALIATTASVLTFAGYKLISSDEQAEIKTQVIQPVEEIIEKNDDQNISRNNEAEESIENVKSEPEIAVKKSSIESQATSKEEHSSDNANVSSVNRDSQSNRKDSEENVAENSSKQAQSPEVVATGANKKDNSENSNKDEHLEESISPEERILQKDIFEASIYASVKEGKQPLEVYFENRGSYSDQAHWIFRDGGSTPGQSASHTFERKGSHWVILEIINSDGRISRDSMEIIVEGKAYVNVPNTFTPNGDGYNDAFMVETGYVRDFTCRILDRNSNMICEWNSIYGHWDGKDKHGNLVPEGAYFYVIEAVDMDGQPLEPKKGIVTLFR